MKQSVHESLIKDFSLTGDFFINDNGLVSVNGNVAWINKDAEKLTVSFKEVSGEFNCSESNLKTLQGSPEEVEIFRCSHNKNLTSLKEGPKKCKKYYCLYCNIQTREGMPLEYEEFYGEGNPAFD